MSLVLRKAHGHSLNQPANSVKLQSSSTPVQSTGPVLQASKHIGAGYWFSTGSEYTEGSPINLTAGVEQNFDLPEVTIDNLRGAFEGHAFSNNGKFQPRAVVDTTILRIAMQGKSSIIGAKARMILTMNGLVIDADEESFHNSAGVQQQTNFKFLNFSGASFVQHGGQFSLISTADAEMWDPRPLIIPISPQ